ncbi:hypothetical protein M8494_21290 [Serratia ureilytica]
MLVVQLHPALVAQRAAHHRAGDACQPVVCILDAVKALQFPRCRRPGPLTRRWRSRLAWLPPSLLMLVLVAIYDRARVPATAH